MANWTSAFGARCALALILLLAVLPQPAGAAPVGYCISSDLETCVGLGQADCTLLSSLNAGCTWSNGACTGTPTCINIDGPGLCSRAGCEWYVPCNLGTGSPCTPGTQAPSCCISGICNPGTNTCCRDEDFMCASNAECCGGLCNVGVTGRCVACLSLGASGCSNNADCCAGSTCQGSKCMAPEACKQEGDRCPAGNCCRYPDSPSDLYCDSLNSQSNPTCRQCADAGEKCDAAFGCCAGQCDSVSGTCPQPAVEVKNFGDILPIAALAAIGTLILVALVYMGGEITQNARMLTWAKIEAMQLLTSIAVAAVVISVVFAFAGFQVGEISSMFGTPLPLIYKGYEAQNVTGGALLYLENLAAVSLSNMAQLRYNMAAYEIRTSHTAYECDSVCMLSLSSVNVATFGGESVNLAVTNSMLGTATVAYLSAVFQYFVLQYILQGVFYLFLPLAIVMRALPFMRQFGGALMGIFVALYILYPLMIAADAYIAPSFAKALNNGATLYERTGTACDNSGVKIYGEYDKAAMAETRYLPCQREGVKKEDELANTGASETAMNGLDMPSGSVNGPGLANSIRVNALIFLTAVFLPALNFIVIAALARDLSRFLGDESDISRLGQMV